MPTKKEKQPLSVTHPELAKEAEGWDPSTVTFGSGKNSSGSAFKVINGMPSLALEQCAITDAQFVAINKSFQDLMT